MLPNVQEILANEYGYGQLGYLRELAKPPPFLGGSLYSTDTTLSLLKGETMGVSVYPERVPGE